MKKLLAIISAVCLCAVAFLGGCLSGRDGVDGQNGEDVSIYEIYEAVKEESGNDDLTFLDFINQYLSYDSDELSEATSLKTAMNRSLMSAVSILSEFNYTTRSSYTYGGSSSSITYNEVYAGSGVVIDVDKENGDAYIVTNCHVVYSSSADEAFCENIHVYLYGKETYSVTYTSLDVYDLYRTYEIDDGDWGMTATLVGASITYDLALLKVEGSDAIKNSEVYAASFSTDDVIDVGETVYAVGNSLGDGIAVSSGIITKDSEYISLALDDDENDYRSYRVTRTDAAVNSGNSGGALYNSDGEIIGIVNAKESSTGVDNMGYAIPAATARRVIANMMDNAGTVSADGGLYKGLLGITVATETVDSGLHSDGTAYITEAAVVSTITVDSMAYEVLKENDVITHVKVTSTAGTVAEDFDVTRVYMLIESMLSVREGDTVTLTVKRNGEYIDYDFTFTELTHVD